MVSVYNLLEPSSFNRRRFGGGNWELSSGDSDRFVLLLGNEELERDGSSVYRGQRRSPKGGVPYLHFHTISFTMTMSTNGKVCYFGLHNGSW